MILSCWTVEHDHFPLVREALETTVTSCCGSSLTVHELSAGLLNCNSWTAGSGTAW